MTDAEVVSIIESIQYKRNNARITAQRSHWCDGVEILVSIQVLHRDTGEPGPVNTCQRLPPSYQLNEKTVIWLVHEAVRRLEMHETDECFYFRGERIFDPHKDDRRSA